MKTKTTASMFFFGVAIGCSCADRATKPEQDDQTEERQLCMKNCERKAGCIAEYEDTIWNSDQIEACQENCMDVYFREERAPCHPEAIKGLTCETEAMCPQLYAQGEMCKREGYPFWGCIADPESWAARECSYDKCLANECCADAPPPSQ